MSLTLLIAFALSYYQETILKAPSDWPFDLCLFCPVYPSCSLGGKVTHEQAHNSPKLPSTWRWFSLTVVNLPHQQWVGQVLCSCICLEQL